MEEETDTLIIHDPVTPDIQNSEAGSARSSPMSNSSARSTKKNLDQDFDVHESSGTVHSSSNELYSKMNNYGGRFLRNMPGEASEKGYLSDSDNPVFQSRLAMLNSKSAGGGSDDMKTNFGAKDHTSDLYLSEQMKEVVPPSRSYADTRSPHLEGKAGVPFDMANGKYSAAGCGREEEKTKHYREFLTPHKAGYDSDDFRGDFEGRFDSLTMKKLNGMSAFAEDNPLAAMLQKYAAANSNDRFPESALRTSTAIPGPMNLFGGLPKKRGYNNERVCPPSISYGLPSSIQGTVGLEIGRPDKEPSPHDVFICHICSFVATSNDEFKLHMTIHYDYQCPQCTYSSRTEGRLKRHIKDFHGMAEETASQGVCADSSQSQKSNQPKKFKCRQCQYISYSREDHWSHIKVHIKKDKQLKCIHCPFVTEFKHHLEYHIRNHNGSKPFKCNKCNYSCVNKSMLNSHMKSHTNVYQFRCASCKYATKYSHSLKLHLINKKHLPAVVLNPDGSLPTDGTGSFELVSKRGPPRGPRGPRKSRQHTDSVSPPALLPIFPSNSNPMIPFSQGNEYSWSPSPNSNGVLNGVVASLPAISSSMLASGTATAVGKSLAFPLNMLSQLSNTVAPSAVGYHLDRMPAVTPPPVQCGFCHANYSSLSLLAQHVKMEHAEKLGGFGVKLEATSPLPESATSSYAADGGAQLDRMNHNEELARHLSLLHSKTNAARDQTMLGNPNVTRFAETEADESYHHNRKDRKRKSSEEDSMDFPLDLSRHTDDGRKPAVKMDAAADEDEDMVCTVSQGVAQISRKRSRKGKACKLDVLSLKLQDRWKEEDVPVENNTLSSFESNGQPEQGISNGHEMKRKFNTSSPPSTNWNDSNSWGWRKSSPQISDVVNSGKNGDKEKAEGRKHDMKHGDLSDQDPGSDSLSRSDSLSNSSEGFTARIHAERLTKQSPTKGYYMCDHCGMGFRDYVTHLLHMGYHGYDDPFKCNMCGHRSTDPVAFFVHIARVAHQ